MKKAGKSIGALILALIVGAVMWLLDNKEEIGKVDEILGPINQVGDVTYVTPG